MEHIILNMGQQRSGNLTDQPAQTSATVLAGCGTSQAARVGLVSVVLIVALVGAMSYPAVAAGMVVGLGMGAGLQFR